MTQVVIVRRSNKIAEVECNGHTGYGVEGEDIVCAALSSIVQTALLGLLQVALIDVVYDRDFERGYLKITIPEQISNEQRKTADAILETMLLGVADLYEGFSDFIELEVR